MATKSISYGIIMPDLRYVYIVNAEPGEYLDKIFITTSSTDVIQKALMIDDFNDLLSMLNDGGSAYTTLRMEFTMNIDDRSVTTARVLDDDDEKRHEETCMMIARYIIQHESCCANGTSNMKTLKSPFEIVAFEDEDEDEDEEDDDDDDVICVICQKEYEAEEIIRRLECKHGYHAECISKWLLQYKKVCPICRAETVLWL